MLKTMVKEFFVPIIDLYFISRVSEINRFILDHEYRGISEASQVYRHVPKYDYSHLGDRMREIWPKIVREI